MFFFSLLFSSLLSLFQLLSLDSSNKISFIHTINRYCCSLGRSQVLANLPDSNSSLSHLLHLIVARLTVLLNYCFYPISSENISRALIPTISSLNHFACLSKTFNILSLPCLSKFISHHPNMNCSL